MSKEEIEKQLKEYIKNLKERKGEASKKGIGKDEEFESLKAQIKVKRDEVTKLVRDFRSGIIAREELEKALEIKQKELAELEIKFMKLKLS
ncbi:MAG: hypothetical protein HY929_02920 [Euryarchaeota archaeon]|nr:hypothetical protein [Euryarchaeota archaeon]